jgi:hypothetical protein
MDLSIRSVPLPDGTLDGRPTMLVLTSLLSLAMRSASAGADIAISVSPPAPGSILFELEVPGMTTPLGRIDRLEPPDGWNRGGADQLQVLSLCFAIASRNGGHVALEKTEAGGTMVRFRCTATHC